MRRVLPFGLCLVVLLGADSLTGATSQIGDGDIHVGPPPARNFGTPTVSWMQRSIDFSAAGIVAVDVFVDSQDSDRLELLIDGVSAGAMSGFNRVGQIVAPFSGGPHTIRIQYAKDGMVDEGLDTAWVDNVRIIANNQLIEQHTFSGAVDCDISGWMTGGYGGGWCATHGPERREMRRPTAMAYAGYQAAPRWAGIARDITWPAPNGNNELLVKYFVNSEEGRDFFRVLIDGQVQFQKSGRR